MSTLRDLLAAGRERGVYSAAAWSVGDAGATLDRGWTGTRSRTGPALDGSEVWDLASVTKPVVGLAVMALVDEGALRLDDTVGDHLAAYRGGDKAEVTVRQLLAHTSGIPGQVPLYRDHPTRASLLEAIRLLPLTAAPGTRVQYSSQGFILLGLVAGAAAGQPLDALVQRLVCGPLGMTGTGFRPDAAARQRAVATEDCPWRGRVVVGEVHDENAVVLGGVAAHAGLFAPLTDMERLGRSLAGGARELLRPGTFAEMTTVHSEGLGLRRCLAWQGQDPSGSPAGDSFGPRAYGHTGFTGTSVWVDPATGRYVVLLTNRVHPSRAGDGIVAVRRDVHAAAAALAPADGAARR
ncbi:CubicO group peptidase, beta-lactamase class C family [Actinacidiphila yanglinensis]|uniref:CubicO group peptidase, beta-lactamase class C family n=1 Tax=Actinacidiphila yanglinensis TaxID=310779 RepID=A0A1H6DZN5_9ACTN|nr:serine hydrolase domain-containing protein [Actinacidiphila yanglinensis]SEG90808.1 CubicO group peptidase, beta-lactamase class C family [Actinacidiphila yanglinensis]